MLSYDDGPSAQVRPYFDKQEPSMNPCRMLENFFTFPRHTFGLFPRLKDDWVHGRASRKVPADRLSAPVKGLIRVHLEVVPWLCRKTNIGRMMLCGCLWGTLGCSYSLSIGLPTPLALRYVRIAQCQLTDLPNAGLDLICVTIGPLAYGQPQR